MPWVSSEAMALRLAKISKQLATSVHALLVCDGAGADLLGDLGARWIVMALLPTHDTAMAAPTARSGQMAPNRWAISCRQPRPRAGREPIGAHTWDRVPC